MITFGYIHSVTSQESESLIKLRELVAGRYKYHSPSLIEHHNTHHETR
jgi:hypothetical protein